MFSSTFLVYIQLKMLTCLYTIQRALHGTHKLIRVLGPERAFSIDNGVR